MQLFANNVVECLTTLTNQGAESKSRDESKPASEIFSTLVPVQNVPDPNSNPILYLTPTLLLTLILTLILYPYPTPNANPNPNPIQPLLYT